MRSIKETEAAELHPSVELEINPLRCEHPDLEAIRAYWQKKRDEGRIPARSDLVTSDLKGQLGWVSLIDVLPGGADFRYRLIGTKITLYFNSDTTGKTVREAFAGAPAAGTMMMGLLETVCRDKMALRTFGSLSWMGRDLEDFESLFLPLSDDGASVNMIVNAFAFDARRVYLKRQRI